jgi:hypothetical protein
MPSRQGRRRENNDTTSARHNRRRIITAPSAAILWTLEDFFARSKPIVLTLIMGGSFPLGHLK